MTEDFTEIDDDAVAVRYAPFSKVFPYCAAIVHHGGIGTSSLVLVAGKPMLLVPESFAQPDTAARLMRAGVARVLPRPFYSAETLHTISQLLDSPLYQHASISNSANSTTRGECRNSMSRDRKVVE
jgi:UDP:flavonoid glycosyltransferase YjiC (YdhE family)